MPSKVKPIPEGYHSITPYLIVHDAAKAVEVFRTEDLSPEEIEKRATAAYGQTS